MWKYNLKSNCVEEQPDMPLTVGEGYTRARVAYEKHLATMRSIPVSGKVNWEDGQEVVEGEDFIISEKEFQTGAHIRLKKIATSIQPKEHKSDIEQEAEKYVTDSFPLEQVNVKRKLKIAFEDGRKPQSLTVSNGVEAIEFADWLAQKQYSQGRDRQRLYWFDESGEGVGTTKELFQLFKNK